MRYETPNDYGFRWGQVDVTRIATIGERKVLSVDTDYRHLEVYVSAKGRSVRVWLDGTELREG